MVVATPDVGADGRYAKAPPAWAGGALAGMRRARQAACALACFLLARSTPETYCQPEYRHRMSER